MYNAIQIWLEMCCAVREDYRETTDALRRSYLEWCTRYTGRNAPIGLRRWRTLLLNHPGVSEWRDKRRGFAGIRLLEDWEYKPEIRDVAARLSPHGNRPTTTRALSRAHNGSEGPREDVKA